MLPDIRELGQPDWLPKRYLLITALDSLLTSIHSASAVITLQQEESKQSLLEDVVLFHYTDIPVANVAIPSWTV